MTWTREDLDEVTASARKGLAMREAVQAGKVPEAVAVAAVSRPAGLPQRFEAVPRTEKKKHDTV